VSLSSQEKLGYIDSLRHWWSEFYPVLLQWRTLLQRNTLSRELLVGVFVSILSAISLLGVFSYSLMSRRIVGHVQQEIESLTENTALSLQAFFRQRLNDLDAVSESPLIGDYYKSRDFGLSQEADSYRKVLEDYFVRVSERSQVYYDIFLVNSSGWRICSVRGSAGILSRENTLSVASLMILQQGQKVNLEPMRLNGPDGPFLKRYAKPVFDPNGNFIGGLVLDLDMQHVERILGKVRVGKVGSAFLENEEGQVMLGTRSVPGRSLVSRAVIPELRWKVGVLARADDFLEPLAHIRNVTILFSLLTGFVVMILVMWRISILLKPIQHMVEGTQKFAKGEMTYRIETPRTVELKSLAASFNVMAEALEARGREIEKQLRQLRALREMEEGVIERESEAKILVSCLQAVAKAFGFDRTALYWIDEKRGLIVGKAVFGADSSGFEARFKDRSVPLGGDDILNEVIRTRQPVIIRDVGSDPRLNKDFIEETKTREFAMAPICGKEKVLGVLTADNFYSSRPLDDADKEGLRVFANAVGLAMENVGLFESLRESEAKYRAVLENSPEAVIGLSKEMWINTWNRGAEKIFGWTSAEIVGKPLSALFSADQYEDYQGMMNKVTTTGPLRDYAVKGSAKGGRDLELSVSWGGALENFWMNKEWTLVIRDVTDSKRMQRQMVQNEKLSAVGQLISGIAHELNNPLQAVVGYADLLTEEVRSGSGPGEAKNAPAFLSDFEDHHGQRHALPEDHREPPPLRPPGRDPEETRGPGAGRPRGGGAPSLQAQESGQHRGDRPDLAPPGQSPGELPADPAGLREPDQQRHGRHGGPDGPQDHQDHGGGEQRGDPGRSGRFGSRDPGVRPRASL
jgi:PAS domain S-box-containing protein